MAAHLKPKLLTSTEGFKNKILYADIETIIVNNIHVPIALGYSNFNGINSNVYFTYVKHFDVGLRPTDYTFKHCRDLSEKFAVSIGIPKNQIKTVLNHIKAI